MPPNVAAGREHDVVALSRCVEPRRWRSSAAGCRGCAVPSRSCGTSLSEASVRLSWWVSRAPAATAPATPTICTPRVSVWSKSTARIASVAAGAASPTPRRRVSGPGCAVRWRPWQGQVPGRGRRGHAGAAGRRGPRARKARTWASTAPGQWDGPTTMSGTCAWSSPVSPSSSSLGWSWPTSPPERSPTKRHSESVRNRSHVVQGDHQSVRDEHITDTLDWLMAHHGPGRPAWWAHTPHVGDAQSTWPPAGWSTSACWCANATAPVAWCSSGRYDRRRVCRRQDHGR